VNVASRLQHLAESGEIVLEERAAKVLAKDPRVTVSAPQAVRVKGIDHALEVVHLKLV